MRSQHIDCFQHVVQIVCRFAHTHEHDFAYFAAFARQHHLRHDLRAVELTNQTIATAHAEHATHSAPHLRRDAQAPAR